MSALPAFSQPGSAVRLFSASVLSLLAGQALAIVPTGFVGHFAVVDANNPPAEYTVFNGPSDAILMAPFVSGHLGGWSVLLTNGGKIDTTSAPDSINLSAAPPIAPPLPPGGVTVPMAALMAVPAIAELKIQAPSMGTFTFDYSFEVGQMTVFTAGGLQVLTGGGTLTLTLAQNEEFGFRVEGEDKALLVPGRGVAAPAAPGNHYFTISNPVFVSVPESSSVAAILGVAGLVGCGWLRQRRPV